MYQPESALKAIKELLNFFRENHLPVYFVQHFTTPEASFFIPDTEGMHIHQDIAQRKTETVVIKHAPNIFLQQR